MTTTEGRSITMAECEACHARILWKRSFTTGKPAPVDATPCDDGNVVLVPPESYRVLTKEEMRAAPSMGRGGTGPRFKLHFATCPEAARFRRCTRCHKTPCRCERVPA